MAEICLYGKDGALHVKREWQAHRTLARDILKVCSELIDETGLTFSDLEGIVVFRGPGSFTGLRIGITVANTMAYSQSIPVVGAQGDDWRDDGMKCLQHGEDDKTVLPDYGAPPRITAPRK